MTQYITIDTASGIHKHVQKKYDYSGQDVLSLIQNFVYPVGILIGSFNEEMSLDLLNTRPDMYLYFVNNTDFNSNSTFRQIAQYGSGGDIKPLESRYTFYRMELNDAFSNFTDDSVDFIFVNSSQNYELILKNYWAKLRRGGLFSGNNYQTDASIYRSVNDFANFLNVQVSKTNNDVWYWYKG